MVYSSTLERKWVYNDVSMSNGRNWSLFFVIRFFRTPLVTFFTLLDFFFEILKLFAKVTFLTTTLDKVQFLSQARLAQFNVIIPISLKLRLCANFIKRGSEKYFFFVGGQSIVNYWNVLQDFQNLPQKFCAQN